MCVCVCVCVCMYVKLLSVCSFHELSGINVAMSTRKTKSELLSCFQEDAVPDLGLPIDIHIEEVTPETAFDPPSFKYISLISLILDKGLAIPLRRCVLCSI